MSLYTRFAPEFAAARKPWSEYIHTLTRGDSVPYSAPLHTAPMYRGWQRGREGHLMKEGVQIHYSRFPDEHMFTNLSRWRAGQMTGDLRLQQFRNAQPHLLDDEDPQGFRTPEAEEFLKLNYKNPRTFCKYLTRAGTYIPRDVSPVSPEAHKRIVAARTQAKHLGLFPKFGNPFWHRLQAQKQKPYEANFDPVKATCKQMMEQFCFHWLQNYRIQQYFKQKESQRVEQTRTARGENVNLLEMGYETITKKDRRDPAQQPTGELKGTEQLTFTSGKETTVAGLMSVAGLRKNYHLYSSSRRKRIGKPIMRARL